MYLKVSYASINLKHDFHVPDLVNRICDVKVLTLSGGSMKALFGSNQLLPIFRNLTCLNVRPDHNSGWNFLPSLLANSHCLEVISFDQASAWFPNTRSWQQLIMLFVCLRYCLWSRDECCFALALIAYRRKYGQCKILKCRFALTTRLGTFLTAAMFQKTAIFVLKWEIFVFQYLCALS